MTEPVHTTLVRELAERIVVAVAPDELEMFPALADAFVTDPKTFLSGRGDRDDPLGFGAGEVGALVSPAALFVASAVVDHAANRFVTAVIDRGHPLLARLARTFHLRPKVSAESGPGTPLPLTQDQANEVRRVVLEKASGIGVPEATAGIIADAVAGSLMLDAGRSRLYVTALPAGEQAEAEVATESEVGDDGADQHGQNGLP